jgi:N utilization substance protein B
MPARITRSRQRALQLLFLWDARRQPLEDVFDAYFGSLYAEQHPEHDAFAESLVRGAVEHVSALDERIAKHADNWRMERMPAVDRNILRLGVYEMSYAGTPAAVVIDEALELAHKFSGEESAKFVNGVLDAIHRETISAAAPPQ